MQESHFPDRVVGRSRSKRWLDKYEGTFLCVWAAALAYPIVLGPSGTCDVEWLRATWMILALPPLFVLCGTVPSLINDLLEKKPGGISQWTQDFRETISQHYYNAPRMWTICALLLPLTIFSFSFRYVEFDQRDGSDARVHDRVFGTWYPIRNEDCVIP